MRGLLSNGDGKFYMPSWKWKLYSIWNFRQAKNMEQVVINPISIHIGPPGYLVTNLVKHLVTNLVIHWILWSIWWQYWWHILWGTKFVTIFGEHSITLFGDSLKLSPYLVTFLSHNLSLNQFTKFFTKYCTNCFPMFRDNSVTISVLTNFSQN